MTSSMEDGIIKLQMSNKPRTKVYGVDFSGAKNACKKIWISEGVIQDNNLLINNCWQISDFLDNNQKKDRYSCHTVLKDFIAENINVVFGLDVPFGVPETIMDGYDWKYYTKNFAYMFNSPEGFRNSCLRKTGFKELKRNTDIDKKAPFCVYNLRLYKQTFYGIRDIIYPLIRENQVSIPPMESLNNEKSWLIEICPACTLKQKQLYIPYKGKTEKEQKSRMKIVEYFNSRFNLSPKVKESAIKDKEGDALDSVIATIATYNALDKISNPCFMKNIPNIYKKEGYTFT
ncbi:conserved hypothetical protein [Methanohalobium evestigatum Z-7303]|uniref:DUF429 domain-containing protein n=1 Tax=Methanohalobium evestigatum (strain ATCC BAA-1072 / DSM 3721 / NBRC 107634 / OCM 161 / Z-7303) TaxID=644295 RepID=D7EAH8_METEZ|nr:hypothetical protein [Methanohalobium evestigatum]ADI74977.1 conserved hypothetical protein [Methanohalobium evestigatum Z-7303]